MGAAGAGAGGGGESSGELGGVAAGQVLEWLILSASCNRTRDKLNCGALRQNMHSDQMQIPLFLQQIHKIKE
jgi:hypothetical protein